MGLQAIAAMTIGGEIVPGAEEIEQMRYELRGGWPRAMGTSIPYRPTSRGKGRQFPLIITPVEKLPAQALHPARPLPAALVLVQAAPCARHLQRRTPLLMASAPRL